MSDPPGLPSALGIEAVECIPEGGSLTVRVTGRWRRRRPEWRGPAILVVEAHRTRYRFPAMPEPPSVSGTMPGTWRMTFSVARELGPHLAGRAWLQLGSLIAPLPVLAESKIGGAGEGSTPPPPVEDAPEPGRLQAGRRPPGELAIDTARRRADEAEALAAELALRVEQLERALRRLRRTADEAVHLAAGERAARMRAERLAQERPAPAPEPAPADAVAERIREERRRTLASE